MKELLDMVTAWLVIASLVIGAAICGYAGWQGRGWWERRGGARPPAVAPVKPEPAPVAPGKPLGPARGKYVPPELGVDLARIKGELAAAQARERAFIGGWIDACDDSTIATPPAEIRYDDLYQDWVNKYFAVSGRKPEAPKPEPVPTPEEAVNQAIRQYGLGIWPGLTTMAEYRLGVEGPVKDRINYTLALTCDFAVLHRFRLAGHANVYEAGANLGYHLPGLGSAFRNTYLRGLVSWRYDGGRAALAPDAVGLGVGTQF